MSTGCWVAAICLISCTGNISKSTLRGRGPCPRPECPSPSPGNIRTTGILTWSTTTAATGTCLCRWAKMYEAI